MKRSSFGDVTVDIAPALPTRLDMPLSSLQKGMFVGALRLYLQNCAECRLRSPRSGHDLHPRRPLPDNADLGRSLLTWAGLMSGVNT